MRSRWILVQHDPMRPGAVGVVGHEEAVELDPVGRHALAELLDGPRRPARGGRRRPGCWCRPTPPRRGRARTAGWRAAGSPPRRRRAAGAATRIWSRSRSGTKPVRAGACRRRPGRPCIAQRWTGRRTAPRPRRAGSERTPSAGSPPRGRGVDDHVEHGRSVAGRGEEGAPDQRRRPTRASTARPSRGAALGRGDGQQLGLGQRRVVVGRSRPCARSAASAARSGPLRSARSTTAMSTRSSTAANVTRYREPVAKPRTPKGRARLTVERLAERYPGTATELCALDSQGPVPAPGGHDPVGPEHRRAGQHGDAGALRRLSRRRGRWPRRTPRTSRRSSAPPGSSAPRPRASSAWPPPWRERYGGEVPLGARGAGDHPRRRAQDGQRGAQRRVRSSGPSGRHARAAGQRSGSASLDGLTPAAAARPGQGRARAELADPARRAGRLQPPRDPARAGDMRCPKTALRRMPLGRFLPLGTVIGARDGLSAPF